jgi:hypothetical protein
MSRRLFGFLAKHTSHFNNLTVILKQKTTAGVEAPAVVGEIKI